ncbi:MAG: OmpA family protein [Spirochaetota bacterium]|jgi:outer membrane protein OmpA-like peptidoglycan-associated protein
MNNSEIKSDYWLSISDMMAGVLIIFILMFILKINADYGLHKKYKDLVSTKEVIVEELKEKFKDYNNIYILDDGTVRFLLGSGGKINSWFEFGEYTLTDSAKQDLEKFIPKYLSVLYKPEYKKWIKDIVVEGHTDNQSQFQDENSNYLFNLNLSQRRAYSVVEFVLNIDQEILSDKGINYDYRDKITANGKSYSNLIIENGEINLEISRRVEFKFNLDWERVYMEFVNDENTNN